MSRETSQALRDRLHAGRAAAQAMLEADSVAVRLATVERAYDELLVRVRQYERERAEIRSRLERILIEIGRPGLGGGR
jgi:multidrug efflux pump subunit AcrA (membrane-fusion protein)